LTATRRPPKPARVACPTVKPVMARELPAVVLPAAVLKVQGQTLKSIVQEARGKATARQAKITEADLILICLDYLTKFKE